MNWWTKLTEGLQMLSKTLLWVLGTCLAAVVAFFAWKKTRPDATVPAPPVPSMVQAEVDAAHESALKERIEAAAVAEEHKTELKQILANPDGDARRKQLAELLKKL